MICIENIGFLKGLCRLYRLFVRIPRVLYPTHNFGKSQPKTNKNFVVAFLKNFQKMCFNNNTYDESDMQLPSF